MFRLIIVYLYFDEGRGGSYGTRWKACKTD